MSACHYLFDSQIVLVIHNELRKKEIITHDLYDIGLWEGLSKPWLAQWGIYSLRQHTLSMLFSS